MLDAAAVLLGLEGGTDADAVAQRRRCREIIEKGQAKDGGWGPYVTAPPEAFDTAVVLLALVQFKDDKALQERRKRGRDFLLSMQRPDGSWPETTRPAGAESYAQRISTTAWATLALLASK